MHKSTTTGGALRPQRDHAAPRRAYLDTYAKRRSGITYEAVPQPVQVKSEDPTIQEVQQIVAAPAPVPSPASMPTRVTISTSVVAGHRPAVADDMFVYSSTPRKTRQTAVENSVVQDVASSHQGYIDDLSRRNIVVDTQSLQHQAVPQTQYFEPETQPTFESSQQEARIGANLDVLYSDSLSDIIAKNSSSASGSHVRTIIASALACGVLAVGIFSFFSQYSSPPVVAQPIGSPVIEVESSNTQAPQGADKAAVTGLVTADPAHPVNLLISSIGVNAPVQGLGTTPDGLIDVPKAYGVVGWYNKGSVPGTPGPAVLVGHYAGGNGAVFDKLGTVNNGDLITVTNGKGQTFTYKVTAKNEYDKDKVPMAQIFKSSTESRLEIITCAGKWQAKTYNNRLVITAELVK